MTRTLVFLLPAVLLGIGMAPACSDDESTGGGTTTSTTSSGGGAGGEGGAGAGGSSSSTSSSSSSSSSSTSGGGGGAGGSGGGGGGGGGSSSSTSGGPIQCMDLSTLSPNVDFPPCNLQDQQACLCEGCTDDNVCFNAQTQQADDCVCLDCHDSQTCNAPSACNNDGLCNPYYEGCACADCANHPEC